MKNFISKRKNQNWFLLFLFSLWINGSSLVEASESEDDTVDIHAGVGHSGLEYVIQSAKTEEKELEGKLPAPGEFIQAFTEKEYYRPLVSRFIKACPSQKNLAKATGVSASVISKLKKPEVYGELAPSAQRVWEWVNPKDIITLKKELNLGEDDVRIMARSLGSVELSKQNIVWDDLAKKLSTPGQEDSNEPFLVSEVVAFLKPMRGTIRKISFAHNLISDEGLRVLVPELIQHLTLRKLNLRDNMITDKGLIELKPLLKLGLLEALDLSENYGPSSDKVLKVLYKIVPRKNREKIKILAEDIE